MFNTSSWILVTFFCSGIGCVPLPDVGPMTEELCNIVVPGFVRQFENQYWIEAECRKSNNKK